MKTKTAYFISVVVSILLLFIVPKNFISSNLGGLVLTISTFLFGLIAGFYIVVTTTDYNSLKNILASETAGWIYMAASLDIYDKKLAQKIFILIDAYVRRTFDFEIIDYAKQTNTEFEKIIGEIGKIKMKEGGESIYEKIQDAKWTTIETRQKLTVLGTKALSFFQWAILLILAVLVVSSLFGLRTGEIFFDVVTVMVSSSTVLILFLIRDLDLYVWNEKTFGYDIFQNVFTAIGKLPYYPDESISARRVNPTQVKYRVGIFTDFPNTLERKIEIRKSKPKNPRQIFDYWK